MNLQTPKKTDKTMAAIKVFLATYGTPANYKAMIHDLGALVDTAVKECTDYAVAPLLNSHEN